MQHLRRKLFKCKEDFGVFKKGELYLSSSSNGDSLSIATKDGYKVVSSTDLALYFEQIDSHTVLWHVITDLKKMVGKNEADNVTAKFFINEEIEYIEKLLNVYKSAAT